MGPSSFIPSFGVVLVPFSRRAPYPIIPGNHIPTQHLRLARDVGCRQEPSPTGPCTLDFVAELLRCPIRRVSSSASLSHLLSATVALAFQPCRNSTPCVEEECRIGPSISPDVAQKYGHFSRLHDAGRDWACLNWMTCFDESDGTDSLIKADGHFSILLLQLDNA